MQSALVMLEASNMKCKESKDMEKEEHLCKLKSATAVVMMVEVIVVLVVVPFVTIGTLGIKKPSPLEYSYSAVLPPSMIC